MELPSAFTGFIAPAIDKPSFENLPIGAQFTFSPALADVPWEVSNVTTIQSDRRTLLPSALTGIPPFPAVAIKSLQFISNESGQLRALSELIATDAALSGEILRVVNSPLFGM